MSVKSVLLQEAKRTLDRQPLLEDIASRGPLIIHTTPDGEGTLPHTSWKNYRISRIRDAISDSYKFELRIFYLQELHIHERLLYEGVLDAYDYLHMQQQGCGYIPVEVKMYLKGIETGASYDDFIPYINKLLSSQK